MKLNKNIILNFSQETVVENLLSRSSQSFSQNLNLITRFSQSFNLKSRLSQFLNLKSRLSQNSSQKLVKTSQFLCSEDKFILIVCKNKKPLLITKNFTSFTDKMYNDDIIELLHRINDLVQLNINLARIRLAAMAMELNKYMRMVNGNRRIKVLYQNVPGTLSKSNTILTIQSILVRLDPDILAIAEPCHDDIDIDWSPYKLLKGHIQNGTKTRLNVLIKSNLDFVQSCWRVELPNAVIKLEGWTFVFTYREWAKSGDQSTKDITSQEERWRGFVNRWSKERGKQTMVIGDMNFHYFGQQGSQKQLKQIRDQVHENIIAEGWSQLINQNTRYQKNCTPSCLDHIYSRSTADVEYVKNFNETGYDHNCVGVYINVSKRILPLKQSVYMIKFLGTCSASSSAFCKILLH